MLPGEGKFQQIYRLHKAVRKRSKLSWKNGKPGSKIQDENSNKGIQIWEKPICILTRGKQTGNLKNELSSNATFNAINDQLIMNQMHAATKD